MQSLILPVYTLPDELLDVVPLVDNVWIDYEFMAGTPANLCGNPDNRYPAEPDEINVISFGYWEGETAIRIPLTLKQEMLLSPYIMKDIEDKREEIYSE